MTVVLPRLDRDQAAALIAAARAVGDPAQVAVRLPDTTVERVWPAVGDARVPDSTLAALRASLLGLATEHNFPGLVRQPGAFDAAAARIVRTSLDLSPHEAAHEAAWTYLTCCWLLDLAVWRFDSSTDKDRYLGHVNRNTFRRLWWRAEILGDSIDLSRFGEDELVNIMERPTLTADPFVARTVASEFLAALDARPGLPRMRLMRDAAKRLMRLTPFVDLSSLDDHQLVARVHACFAEATAALTGTPVPVPLVGPGPATRRAPSPEVSVAPRVTITDSLSGPHAGESRPSVPAAESSPPPGSPTTTSLTPDQVGLIATDLARRTGRVTNQALRDALGVTREEALRVLTREAQRGSLVRHGTRRGTYYSLPDSGQTPAGGADDAGPEDGDNPTGAAGGGRPNRTVLSRLLNRRS